MIRAEKKEPNFDIWSSEKNGITFRIIKNKLGNMYSVYAKRYDSNFDGYIEVSSNHAKNLWQAKDIADKLMDICLGYKPPKPGREL